MTGPGAFVTLMVLVAAPAFAQRRGEPVFGGPRRVELNRSETQREVPQDVRAVPLADSTRTPRLGRGGAVFLFGVAGAVGGAAMGARACEKTNDACFFPLAIAMGAGVGLVGGLLVGIVLTAWHP